MILVEFCLFNGFFLEVVKVFVLYPKPVRFFIEFRDSSVFWVIWIDYLLSFIIYIITFFYFSRLSNIAFHPFFLIICCEYIILVSSFHVFFCPFPFWHRYNPVFVYGFHLL